MSKGSMSKISTRISIRMTICLMSINFLILKDLKNIIYQKLKKWRLLKNIAKILRVHVNSKLNKNDIINLNYELLWARFASLWNKGFAQSNDLLSPQGAVAQRSKANTITQLNNAREWRAYENLPLKRLINNHDENALLFSYMKIYN